MPELPRLAFAGNELRHPGLAGSISRFHAAECLGGDMERLRRGGMMDFPTKRRRTDPDSAHDHADGEGFLGHSHPGCPSSGSPGDLTIRGMKDVTPATFAT
jgi:hypothetical protein